MTDRPSGIQSESCSPLAHLKQILLLITIHDLCSLHTLGSRLFKQLDANQPASNYYPIARQMAVNAMNSDGRYIPFTFVIVLRMRPRVKTIGFNGD